VGGAGLHLILRPIGFRFGRDGESSPTLSPFCGDCQGNPFCQARRRYK
jgi:hypothetical protein